ncbi:MAG: hypothetical protein R2867_00895 [Caldilineaceae bacterium]
MTAAVGYPTLRLVRWAIGPLTLGTLKLREQKPLTHQEVAALRMVASGAPKRRRLIEQTTLSPTQSAK